MQLQMQLELAAEASLVGTAPVFGLLAVDEQPAVGSTAKPAPGVDALHDQVRVRLGVPVNEQNTSSAKSPIQQK